MHKKPAKFFDSILKLLCSEYNKSFTIDEIVKVVYKKELLTISKSNKLDSLFDDVSFKSNVINAVMFLKQDGLIAYNSESEIVFINTKGFLSHKTETFTRQINNKTINLFLQRISWVCAVFALFVSLWVAFIKDTNSNPPTILLNCNCNHSNLPTVSVSDSIKVLKFQRKTLKMHK